MKEIRSICFALLLALCHTALAQSESDLGFPAIPPINATTTTTTGPTTSTSTTTLGIGLPTTSSRSPAIDILQTTQPFPTSVPGGVLTPAVTALLKGLSDEAAPIDGVIIQIDNGRDAITGFQLFERGVAIGPLLQVQNQYQYQIPILADRTWLEKDQQRRITVHVMTKPSLKEYVPGFFSISVVGISTTASVGGLSRVNGGLMSLDGVTKAGRLTFAEGAGIVSQDIFPFASGQPLVELLIPAEGTENHDMSIFEVGVRGEGGLLNDMQLSLHNNDGSIIQGGMQVSASMMYGQGSVKFQNPFSTDKSPLGRVVVRIKLGPTWKNGGKLAGFIDPTKSRVSGQSTGYLTIPSSMAIISGPAMTVTPVATVIENAVQIDTAKQIPAGTTRLNLSVVAITAPADKDLALPTLGVWIGWNHGVMDNLNIYGFTDAAMTRPIPGLQPGGSFRKDNLEMGFYNRFDDLALYARDISDNPSAIIIPMGETWYFVSRADFTTSGTRYSVTTGIFDPLGDVEDTLTFEQKSQ